MALTQQNKMMIFAMIMCCCCLCVVCLVMLVLDPFNFCLIKDCSDSESNPSDDSDDSDDDEDDKSSSDDKKKKDSKPSSGASQANKSTPTPMPKKVCRSNVWQPSVSMGPVKPKENVVQCPANSYVSGFRCNHNSNQDQVNNTNCMVRCCTGQEVDDNAITQTQNIKKGKLSTTFSNGNNKHPITAIVSSHDVGQDMTHEEYIRTSHHALSKDLKNCKETAEAVRSKTGAYEGSICPTNKVATEMTFRHAFGQNKTNQEYVKMMCCDLPQ